MPETESPLALLAHARRRHMTTELVPHGLTALLFGLEIRPLGALAGI